MPHVFVGSLERAEAYADAEKPVASPGHAGHNHGLPDGLRLAVVDSDLELLVDSGFQKILQRVVVLILRGNKNFNLEKPAFISAASIRKGKKKF